MAHFWWPTNQRHYIRWYLKLLIPTMNNFISSLSARYYMMTSSNGNIFCVTGHLCGEFTGHGWIPRTKASDAELWCFLCWAWINGLVNNPEAGDLRRYRAHCDVIVMNNRKYIPTIRRPAEFHHGLDQNHTSLGLHIMSPRWIGWHHERWWLLWFNKLGITKCYCFLSQRNIRV